MERNRQMLRFLALLVICTVSFLMQGGPAFAREAKVVPFQSINQPDAGTEVILTASTPADDCSSRLSCCTMMCAPCKVPLPGHRGEFLWRPLVASALPGLPDDCLRSIILSRDPPVPRLSSL